MQTPDDVQRWFDHAKQCWHNRGTGGMYNDLTAAVRPPTKIHSRVQDPELSPLLLRNPVFWEFT